MTKYARLEAELQKSRKRWLVTGSAGFIGSHLVERLLNLGQEVVGLDNFATGKPENVALMKSLKTKGRYEFIEGDICDFDLGKKLTGQADYVLHQAALGSVPRSIEKPLGSHVANVNGFVTLLKAATESGVKKFVYASSSAVYGDNPNLPKVEHSIGQPLSPYAATKLIDEIYAGTFHRSYGSPAVGLRYFNVFGPRQDPEGPYAAVIPLWISSMMAGRPTFVNGDGSNSRDFCFVENVVQANILAALSGADANGQVFNLAYGQRTTLLELHTMMREAVQKLKPNLRVTPPTHREDRPGDVPHSLADITLAKKLLGYEPVVPVAKGIVSTVEHFTNQLRPAA